MLVFNGFVRPNWLLNRNIILGSLIVLCSLILNVDFAKAQSGRDGSFFIRQAEIAYSQNRFEDVQHLIDRAQAIDGITDAVQYWKVKALYRDGKYDVVKDDYRQALEEIRIFNTLDSNPETKAEMKVLEDKIKAIIEEDNPQKPKERPDEIFTIAEIMPEVIGGTTSIYQHVIYPQEAIENNIEGVVVLRFVVDEGGNVSDIRVVRSIGGGCDEAAIAALKKVSFKSAEQRGKKVKAYVSLPIRFKLQ